MTMKRQYAKGMAYVGGGLKIYYGDSTNVEKEVYKGNKEHRSIYFYETEDDMNCYIDIEREFLKDDMDSVEFIQL